MLIVMFKPKKGGGVVSPVPSAVTPMHFIYQYTVYNYIDEKYFKVFSPPQKKICRYLYYIKRILAASNQYVI